MAKDRTNIRMYGDLESEVFLAPKGTQLPETLDDPSSPFQSVGWLSEDGVSLEVSTDVTKLKGWQGGSTLRTKVTSTEKTVTFQALEESPFVTALYFGAKEKPEVSGGVARMDLPSGIGVVERAAVLKFVDGTVTKFIVCEAIEITERGTLNHQNSEATIYEFTAEIVGDAYVLTNAPSFVEAGDE